MTTAAKAAARAPSRLGKATSGYMDVPLRAFLYGDEGVGKSTLAADAVAPIFFDLEAGTARISATRYSFRDSADGHIPLTIGEVFAGIDDLLTATHDFKTLVIDTVDRLEPLIWNAVCAKYSGIKSAINKGGKTFSNIEDLGYGKGFQIALDGWRALVVRLDELRLRAGMDVVLLGHSQVRAYKNPLGEDYDRISPRIHQLASGFLKEWSDLVGYCCFEEGGAALSDDEKPKAYSTGRRLIRLRRTAGYDAKTRYPLPDEVEISVDHPWQPFADAMVTAKLMDAGQVMKLIEVEIARVDTATGAAIRAYAEQHLDNVETLARVLAKARLKPSKGEE